MSNRGTTIDYPVTGFSKCIVGYSTALVELIFALVVSDNKLFDVTHFGWWWLDDSPQKLWRLFLSHSPPRRPPTLRNPFCRSRKGSSLKSELVSFNFSFLKRALLWFCNIWSPALRLRGDQDLFLEISRLYWLEDNFFCQYISFTVGRPASGHLLCCLLGWFFAPILWIQMTRSSSRTLGKSFSAFHLVTSEMRKIPDITCFGLRFPS